MNQIIFSNDPKHFSKTLLSSDSFELVVKQIDLKNLDQSKSPSLKSFFCETKFWDIDLNMKRWFFSKYFNFEELFVFFSENKIDSFDNFSGKFMLHKNPIIHGLFYFCENNLKRLLNSNVEDEEYFEVTQKFNFQTTLLFFSTILTSKQKVGKQSNVICIQNMSV